MYFAWPIIVKTNEMNNIQFEISCIQAKQMIELIEIMKVCLISIFSLNEHSTELTLRSNGNFLQRKKSHIDHMLTSFRYCFKLLIKKSNNVTSERIFCGIWNRCLF